ncbi:immunoglobulin-like domain-containing protein [uncultured Amphritea sp.]|uniref:immunoglobulin-like domain-containing protein n=1 Tax=uncultured Amphritea sp. TaxID=981605 RepID=UPI0026117154|nr:immunoglobulin-like domain-containing protein [uncultured Amphritea sp.]
MRFINALYKPNLLAGAVNLQIMKTQSSGIKSTGGNVYASASFRVRLPAGGLTGMTAITIGGVSCTDVTVISDTEMTAIAPADGLLHKDSVGDYINHTLEITGAGTISINNVRYLPASAFNVSVIDTASPTADSVAFGAVGLAVNDNIVFQRSAVRTGGGTGSVVLDAAGVPTISGLPGEYTFSYHLIHVATGLKYGAGSHVMTVADVDAPSVPQNLLAAATGETTGTATWDAASDNVGVDHYVVYLNSVEHDTTSSTTYDFTGLTDTTPYSVTVSAVDAAGNESDQSAADTFTTVTPDTNAPVITLLGSSTPTIAHDSVWTDPGATAYDDEDGDITASIVVTGTVDTGSVGSYVLSYNVSDSAGNSATQVQRTVSVTDQVAPTVPDNVVGVSTGSDSGSVTWDASTDAVGVTGYKVFVNSVEIEAAATSPYSITGLVAETSYSVQVSAYDAAGNESTLSAASVFATDVVPTVTRNITPLESAGSQYYRIPIVSLPGDFLLEFEGPLISDIFTIETFFGLESSAASKIQRVQLSSIPRIRMRLGGINVDVAVGNVSSDEQLRTYGFGRVGNTMTYYENGIAVESVVNATAGTKLVEIDTIAFSNNVDKFDGPCLGARVWSAGTLIRDYRVDEDWASDLVLLDYSGNAQHGAAVNITSADAITVTLNESTTPDQLENADLTYVLPIAGTP